MVLKRVRWVTTWLVAGCFDGGRLILVGGLAFDSKAEVCERAVRLGAFLVEFVLCGWVCVEVEEHCFDCGEQAVE